MGKGLVVGLVLALASRAAAAQGISAKYPGDQGIESDPSVVFVEKFDDAGMTTVLSRWQDKVNPGALSLSTDRPPGSAGGRSLEMNGNVVRAGYNTSYLYKSFTPEVGDTAYIRYYIKYLNSAPSYHHAGCHFGGYNPATPWPQGIAGVKPTGSDHFQINTEPFSNNEFGFYSYWMGMQPDGRGDYWGNVFHQAPNLLVNTWFCVEVMVKLNNPVSASNGELAYWINGTKIMHFGPGFPKVTRNGGNWWIDANGSPFPGFQWRNTLDLKLNFMWIQNDVADRLPPGSLRIDHIVVARSYVGPIKDGTVVNPLPPPTPISPAEGSSVTGPDGTFTWAPPSGADASTWYQIRVEFPDGSHVEPWVQGVSRTTIPLGAAGPYRWYARSRTGTANEGPWSAPINFSLTAPVVPPPPPPPPPPAPSGTTGDLTGTYRLVARHSGKVLDVSGSKQYSGAFLVHQWAWWGGDNQKWKIEPTDSGYYRLTAIHSGKVLDVAGASMDDGAQLIQWDWVGGSNQQWKIESTGDGFYRLLARHSGKALDVYGASLDNGAPIIQWTPHGGGNQQWDLVPLAQVLALSSSTTAAEPIGSGGDPAQKCGATGAEIWILMTAVAFLRARRLRLL